MKFKLLFDGKNSLVSKAYSECNKAWVAIKTISMKEKCASQIEELVLLLKCNTPFIVSCYGACIFDGDLHIIMEFMNVHSLDAFLKGHMMKKDLVKRDFSFIPEKILLVIIYSVLEGLIYLYDRLKVCHRDLKPSNVLLDSNGMVKLCDLGISGRLSKNNFYSGTCAYMSPERLYFQDNFDIRSDVWSLGITILELAYGRYPLCPNLTIFEQSIWLKSEPIPLVPKHYSDNLRKFVSLCVIKDAKRRPSPFTLINEPLLSAFKDKNYFLHSTQLMSKWLVSQNV